MVTSDNRVTADDLKRASMEAKRRQPDEGRSCHHVRTPIILDQKVVDDPVGMLGNKVDLGYWSIDGDDKAIQMGLHVISNYSLEVDDLILSSIASATMVAGQTCEGLVRLCSILVQALLILWFIGKAMLHTGVIPVGGDHITVI